MTVASNPSSPAFPRPTVLQSLRGRFADLWLKVLIWTLMVFFGVLVAFLVTRTWRVG